MDFSMDELEVLETVVGAFRGARSKDIVDYMHLERAYVETALYQMIPFSLCRELRELK